MKSLDHLKLYETISQQAKLVIVSKTHPWSECVPFYERGARNFGENRLQDALPKIEEAPKDIDWHFIGVLQKNKVAKVVSNFALIQSVDSFELAEKISKSSQTPTRILLQINIQHQHGFRPDDLRDQFLRLQTLPNLSIEGLMTMAPHIDDKKILHSVFKEARLLKEELKLKELSMGMSNDWQIALEEGATILRVGSLFFT